MHLGDLVLASGFMEVRHLIAFFVHAVVKKLAPGNSPPAVALSVEEILDESQNNPGRAWGHYTQDFDGRLVRF